MINDIKIRIAPPPQHQSLGLSPPWNTGPGSRQVCCRHCRAGCFCLRQTQDLNHHSRSWNSSCSLSLLLLLLLLLGSGCCRQRRSSAYQSRPGREEWIWGSTIVGCIENNYNILTSHHQTQALSRQHRLASCRHRSFFLGLGLLFRRLGVRQRGRGRREAGRPAGATSTSSVRVERRFN